MTLRDEQKLAPRAYTDLASCNTLAPKSTRRCLGPEPLWSNRLLDAPSASHLDRIAAGDLLDREAQLHSCHSTSPPALRRRREATRRRSSRKKPHLYASRSKSQLYASRKSR